MTKNLERAEKTDSNYVDWSGPNWLSAILVAVFVVISGIQVRPLYLGCISHETMISILSSAGTMAIHANISFYGWTIDQFTPTDSLAAKRANEQIKSICTAITALSVGIALSVSINQLTSSNPQNSLIIISVGAALWLHNGARKLLGKLKDESVN